MSRSVGLFTLLLVVFIFSCFNFFLLSYPGSCSCSLSGEIVFPSGHGLCAVPGCVTSGFTEVQRVQEYMSSLLNQVVYCNKDEEYALVTLLVWSIISKFISTLKRQFTIVKNLRWWLNRIALKSRAVDHGQTSTWRRPPGASQLLKLLSSKQGAGWLLVKT